MQTFISTTKKFYWRTTKDFETEVNKILKIASGEMPVTIKNGMADFTTTANCSEAYYYFTQSN